MSRLALLGSLAACAGEPPPPSTPDMSKLVEAYANPTRAFDQTSAAEIEMIVERKVRVLTDLDAVAGKLEDTLAALAMEEPQMVTGGALPVTLEGEGFASIERICSGYGDPAPPVDPANGHLELTVGFNDDGLAPVVFGGAFGCKEQIGSTRLTIAGAVNLFIGENLKITDLRAGPVLFQLADFAFHVNDYEVISGGFDFQVCRGTGVSCVAGYIETLLSLPSGGTLVFFFDRTTRAGGFRGSNGVWHCAFSESRCMNATGGVVTIPRIDL